MSNFETIDFSNITFAFRDLGEKKVLKDALKKINQNKKVHIYYSKYANIPICALPKFKLILSSRTGFLSFCFNFYSFMYHNNCAFEMNHANIRCIAECVISHEVGHILDPNIYKTRSDYSILLSKLIDKLLLYDINIKDKNLHKSNLPADLEECVFNLKKNLIIRECDAWDIAEKLLDFKSDDEKFMFAKIKEYALATYNYGNLNTIIKEHNLETYFKYMKNLGFDI